MNSYFVSITISRRQISFEYHQEGAARPLTPFPGEERWPVPLSLYCTPGRIEIGKAAERAATHNVPGAFKEWFRHLSSGQTVKYLGQQQPVSHLLLLAAEEQFRKFLKEVRMNMDGGLENCRAAMPLVLSFEDDVDDSMRIFLVNLFRNMGYGRVIENFYNRIIATHYFSKLPAERLLIADSDGIDLTLSLYERGRDQAKCSCVIQGAGTDPRVQRVCNMIWDKTGAEYSFMSRNTEQPLLEQMALEVIGANQTEFEGIMNYSNGEQLCFMISRSELVSTGAGTKSTSSDVIRFLEKAGIAPSDVTIMLRNLAAKNQPLQAAFPSSIIFDEDSKEAINQEIVKQIMPRFAGFKVEPEPVWAPIDSIGFHPIPPSPPDAQGELKERTKKWRQVKAEAGGKSKSGQIAEALMILDRFLDECRSCIGTEDLVAEIEREKAIIANTPPLRKTDEVVIRGLKREWREVKAAANGKDRQGNKAAAIEILKRFLGKISDKQDLQELQNSVKTELEALSSLTGVTPPSPEPPLSGRKQRNTQYRPEPKEKLKSDGEVFIEQGKLKEARDWYRNNGNTAKAKVLTDIIRDRKGVELRKDSLEEYKKTKNTDQIRRIISELQDYINLCNSIEFNAQEYVKLLNEYRKIIK